MIEPQEEQLLRRKALCDSVEDWLANNKLSYCPLFNIKLTAKGCKLYKGTLSDRLANYEYRDLNQKEIYKKCVLNCEGPK